MNFLCPTAIAIAAASLSACRTPVRQMSSAKVITNKLQTGSGVMNQKILAITIDDGPSQATWDLLKKVNRIYNSGGKCNVKITFFVTGKLINSSTAGKYREYLDDPKHCYVLGNHSQTHSIKRLKNKKTLREEISDAHQTLTSNELFVDGQVRFLRTPGGTKVNTVVANNATAEDYVGPMFWDIGGAIQGSSANPTNAADWACWSKKFRPSEWRADIRNIRKKCLEGYKAKTKRLKKGIVLFHDVNKKSVPLIMEYLQYVVAEGYKLVRLDEIDAFARMALNRVNDGAALPVIDRSDVGNGDDVFIGDIQDRMSPCTEVLKGACTSRSVCLKIGAGTARSLSDRFRNWDKLSNKQNLQFVSSFCPLDPGPVRCCFNPDVAENDNDNVAFLGDGSTKTTQLGLTGNGGNKSPIKMAIEKLQERLVDYRVDDGQVAKILPIHKRKEFVKNPITFKGVTNFLKDDSENSLFDRIKNKLADALLFSKEKYNECKLDRANFEFRSFYLYTGLKGGGFGKGCNILTFIGKALKGTVTPTKVDMESMLAKAEKCYEERSILSFQGYEQKKFTTTVDFRLTGFDRESDKIQMIGDRLGNMTLTFENITGVLLNGDANIFSGEIVSDFYANDGNSDKIPSSQDGSDTKEESDPHSLAFKFTNNLNVSDKCGMAWAGYSRIVLNEGHPEHEDSGGEHCHDADEGGLCEEEAPAKDVFYLILPANHL